MLLYFLHFIHKVPAGLFQQHPGTFTLRCRNAAYAAMAILRSTSVKIC